MAHRHKHHKKAHGGKVEDTVEKEHEEMGEAKKRGGAVKHAKMHGHKGHHRLDKRARGGGVGADKHPFSSAHTGK